MWLATTRHLKHTMSELGWYHDRIAELGPCYLFGPLETQLNQLENGKFPTRRKKSSFYALMTRVQGCRILLRLTREYFATASYTERLDILHKIRQSTAALSAYLNSINRITLIEVQYLESYHPSKNGDWLICFYAITGQYINHLEEIDERLETFWERYAAGHGSNVLLQEQMQILDRQKAYEKSGRTVVDSK